MGLVAIIVGRFSPYLNSAYRSSNSGNQARNRLGEYGEKVARDWLRANGVKILGRNFKGRRGGEVDIVARDRQGQLLFTEVKTRRAGAKIRGLAAVNRKKRSLIERGANEWLKRLGRRDVPWRFDVIEVEVTEGCRPKITRIENVFQNSRS